MEPKEHVRPLGTRHSSHVHNIRLLSSYYDAILCLQFLNINHWVGDITKICFSIRQITVSPPPPPIETNAVGAIFCEPVQYAYKWRHVTVPPRIEPRQNTRVNVSFLIYTIYSEMEKLEILEKSRKIVSILYLVHLDFYSGKLIITYDFQNLLRNESPISIENIVYWRSIYIIWQ